MFSPRAERYNLALAPAGLDSTPIQPRSAYTAWLGIPGYGLGGMQSGVAGTLGWNPDYTIDPTPLLTPQSNPGAAAVRGMPIQVWSTKSVLGRWTGSIPRSVEAELSPTGDGLVEGRLTNDSGARLDDCRLLYGDWAWRLGALSDGETATVDDSVDPIRIDTLLKNALEIGADLPAHRRGAVSLDDLWGRDLPVEALAPLFAVRSKLKWNSQMANPSQLGCLQLTHHLAAGRALLLARRHDAPMSQLLRDDQNLASDSDNDFVFCRFILEVNEP